MLTYKYNQQSQPVEHDPPKSRPLSLMAAGVDQEDVDELVHSVGFLASAFWMVYPIEQLATGDVFFCLPVVPHKAVAEVSKIGNL